LQGLLLILAVEVHFYFAACCIFITLPTLQFSSRFDYFFFLSYIFISREWLVMQFTQLIPVYISLILSMVAPAARDGVGEVRLLGLNGEGGGVQVGGV
jgi:hypothetical protein